jgi:tetratricopeptide (TPR) repeat protein
MEREQPTSVPEPPRAGGARSPIDWPTFPALVFLGLIGVLGVFGMIGVVTKPAKVSGLPNVPEALDATRQVYHRLRVATGGLRLETAMLGDNRDGHPYSAVDLEAVRTADSLLGEARWRSHDDPRVLAASAALALAHRRFDVAERRYRVALARVPGYGEARLGLGVTLSIQSEVAADPRARRALELRALAQFANVSEDDPAYAPALFNRAILLTRVGRREEAARVAAQYRKLDPDSQWTEVLDRALAGDA